jgi:predicted Zn-dependent protease
LQPLGNFPEKQSPSTEMLRQYAAAFFQMEVKILPSVNIVPGDFTSRTNRTTNRRQILTRDVLRWLQGHLPEDAFCLLGITMEDLYPNPSWNFVFGEASLRERVGVYSFARYDPAFYGGSQEGDYQKLLLWRSAKVLTHETAHMFGLAHKIAPRLLSEIGDDRQRFDGDPQKLQCLAGTAPVTKRSGKQRSRKYWPVHQRWACDKHLRHAIHLFAEQSLSRCVWAELYYQLHRQKNQSHANALRRLGNRSLKIIYQMWINRTPYNAELHHRNQLQHGSWIFQLQQS